MLRCLSALLCLAVVGSAQAAECKKTPRPESPNVPPPGSRRCSRQGPAELARAGHVNPYEIEKWTPEQKKEKQAAADEEHARPRRAEGGEIINDGHGLTSPPPGLPRFRADPRLEDDAGHGQRHLPARLPQVQIWIPTTPRTPRPGSRKARAPCGTTTRGQVAQGEG